MGKQPSSQSSKRVTEARAAAQRAKLDQQADERRRLASKTPKRQKKKEKESEQNLLVQRRATRTIEGAIGDFLGDHAFHKRGTMAGVERAAIVATDFKGAARKYREGRPLAKENIERVRVKAGKVPGRRGEMFVGQVENMKAVLEQVIFSQQKSPGNTWEGKAAVKQVENTKAVLKQVILSRAAEGLKSAGNKQVEKAEINDSLQKFVNLLTSLEKGQFSGVFSNQQVTEYRALLNQAKENEGERPARLQRLGAIMQQDLANNLASLEKRVDKKNMCLPWGRAAFEFHKELSKAIDELIKAMLASGKEVESTNYY